MSKRGFVRGARKTPPSVPPVRIAVAAPLALPEREPRNILLMIALPALLVGIVGTLVVMYASGIRSLQSGFFPMIGLVGFGTLMFSGRFGRGGLSLCRLLVCWLRSWRGGLSRCLLLVRWLRSWRVLCITDAR